MSDMRLETVSGQIIDLMEPNPENIKLDDVAWALSRISRFCGHTITAVPYNVAQHSCSVLRLLVKFKKDPKPFVGSFSDNEIAWLSENLLITDSKKVKCKALLHDAHEAFTGDIPSPVKNLPDMKQTLKVLESTLDNAIWESLGLCSDDSDPYVFENEAKIVKAFDKMAQAIESYQFIQSRGKWFNMYTPSMMLLQEFDQPVPAIEAYNMFKDLYEGIKEGRL